MEKVTSHNEAEMFELARGQIKFDDVIGPHKQTNWELDFVRSGEGLHIFNGLTEPCVEGELILVPNGVTHNWLFDPESIGGGRVDTYTLFFNFDEINQKISTLAEMQQTLRILSSIKTPVEITGASAEAIRKLMMEMNHDNRALRLTDFMKILIHLSETEDWRVIVTEKTLLHDVHVETVMQKIHQFLMSNYNRPITLEEVADIACMNKAACCTFFKKHYTKSIFYVLNEKRVNAACTLLLDKRERDVFEICLQAGFNDIPYFYRTFKKYKGCTPREYREKMGRIPGGQQ